MYVVGRTDKEVACNGIDRDIVDVGDFGAVADEVVRYQSLLQAVVNGQLVWFAICAGNDVGPVVADHESLWPCNIGDGLGNGAAVAYHLEGCRFVYIVARDGICFSTSIWFLRRYSKTRISFPNRVGDAG
jgi:hypothetical protein